MPLRSPLVGRAAELAAIAEAVAAGERLLTITGPPGVGKTRLAEHVARDAGNVVTCNLAHCRSAHAAAAVIGAALGLPMRRRRDDVVGVALAARGPILLVLDNAERLAGHAGAIARWLEQAPAARVIVTSRRRLRLDGELCVPVSPLSLDAAIELYRDRARRAGRRGGFDRDHIARLVERLDRIPLAIELAAARCELLPPARLLERLDDGFGVLRGVAEAIACSWELLGPRERTALTRLSTFRGAFSLEAAETVIALDDVLDLLAALREASLVEVTGDELRLLDSVRDFAARHLTGRAAVQRRHDAWVLAEAERWAARIDSAGEREALDRLARLHDALDALVRRGDPRAARALHAFAAVRLPGLSELAILDHGLVHARGPLRAELLVRRASVLRLLGRLDDASAALASATPLRDPRLRAHELLERGRQHIRCDEPADAAAAFARASELFRAAGDIVHEGRAEAGRSRAAELRDRFDDAVDHAERALALARRCGSTSLQMQSLNAAALALESSGRFEDALALLGQAAAIARATSDASYDGVLEANLGCIRLRQGRLDEAEAYLRRAAALNSARGQRRREADDLVHLALVQHERGDLAAARDLYQQGFLALHECRERRLNAQLLPFRAACAAELRLETEARSDFAAARRAPARLSDPASLAAAEVLEGVLEPRDAAPRLGRAEALLRASDAGRVAYLVIAIRIVRRVLAGTPTAHMVVGPDASWFRAGDRDPVDLTRHATLRRVLAALVDHRLRAPGVALSQHDLFALAWPDDRAQPAAAAGRVYTALSSLRRLGLDAVLRREEHGYLLDASVAIRSVVTRELR